MVAKVDLFPGPPSSLHVSMPSVSQRIFIIARDLLTHPAGNETFGYNLAWLLIELDKRPECLQRLLAEIDSSDTEDFKTVNSKMPYLDAVITEVNRLHPPIASTFRTVNREISVTSRKSNYTLPSGAIVFLALGCANRSIKDWGADAEKFMPERWLERKEGVPSHLAFGYGSRSCVCSSLRVSVNSADRDRSGTRLHYLGRRCTWLLSFKVTGSY